MGGFLDKPKTEKHNEHGTGNGLAFGVSSMQGWRIEMEDAHCAYLGLPHGLDDWSFFAVFDGHAGASVSAYCAKHLMDSIVQTEEFKHYVNVKNSEMGENVGNIQKGIRAGFLQLDEKMRGMPEIVSGEDKSGSTAVCTLISSTHMFIANCGDSRAVLSRNGTAAFSTLDHKPINPMEKERIQNAGGSVMIQRVNGSLAVSRALGDFEYKQVEGKGPCEQLVSPEPEVNVEPRSDKDEFLILACDGVWDVMSNDELCDFVRSRLQLTDSLEQVCNQVVDACLHKGSRDNMSIVLVSFPGAPKASQEAITKEKELERILEKKVAEAMEQKDYEVESFNELLQYLENEDVPGLPPGAGLAAKTEFLETIFNKAVGSSEEGS